MYDQLSQQNRIWFKLWQGWSPLFVFDWQLSLRIQRRLPRVRWLWHQTQRSRKESRNHESGATHLLLWTTPTPLRSNCGESWVPVFSWNCLMLVGLEIGLLCRREVPWTCCQSWQDVTCRINIYYLRIVEGSESFWVQKNKRQLIWILVGGEGRVVVKSKITRNRATGPWSLSTFPRLSTFVPIFQS